MNKNKALDIINYLDNLYPNYSNFLNYNNNFELLIAVILSAQTTDNKVNQVTEVLFKKYNNAKELSNSDYNDVLEIIKPLGLSKTKAKNIIETSKIIHQKYQDVIPNNLLELEMLPGVGRKTANVVLALGFNIPSMPVDTHVKRLAIRLGFAKAKDSLIKVEENLKKYIPRDLWIKAHHLLILYGRNVCKAINPKCAECKLIKMCEAYKNEFK